MLKIFIGPNGYGKTYELEQRRQKLLNEDKDKKKEQSILSSLKDNDNIKVLYKQKK